MARAIMAVPGSAIPPRHAADTAVPAKNLEKTYPGGTVRWPT
jgi:hypothetical protein